MKDQKNNHCGQHNCHNQQSAVQVIKDQELLLFHIILKPFFPGQAAL
jgi:hypothetical protein